jgi:hypothetical protein
MRGHHRFLRTKNGLSSFAHVEVDLTTCATEPLAIIDALPETPNASQGEVNRCTAPAWVDAAVEGIRNAVGKAQSLGVPLDHEQVRLVKLLGTPADTRADAIQCAAALATWQAIAEVWNVPTLEVIFGHGAWSIQYPFALAGTVQGTAK